MLKKNIDYKLFFTVLFIVVFGMMMVSSVSVFESFKKTSNFVTQGRIEEAYNYYYVLRNIPQVIVSLIAMAIIIKIDYKFFEKNAKYFFGFSLFLLIFVLIKGEVIKGASLWISIPGIPFNIQPTEFFKVAFIIFLAFLFKKHNSKLGDFKKGFLPFLGILGGVTLLIGTLPDFGTLMVILPVATIIFYYAGANIKHLLSLGLLGFLLIFTVYHMGDYDKVTGKNINALGYVTQRLDNFLADNKESIKKKTINYQTEQGLIAIGSGGFKGKGFGQSIQKFGYLPEVHGDFIFAVVVEELGFLGGAALMFLYLFIGYRGFYIANHVKDKFAKFAATGITSWVLFQAFINMGVVLNVVPLTGITLPFISYGGSSTLALMIGLGILLSISRYVEDTPEYSRLERKKILI